MTAILRLQLKIDVFSCCFSFVMEKYNSRQVFYELIS